jgi:hypothetical protein
MQKNSWCKIICAALAVTFALHALAFAEPVDENAALIQLLVLKGLKERTHELIAEAQDAITANLAKEGATLNFGPLYDIININANCCVLTFRGVYQKTDTLPSQPVLIPLFFQHGRNMQKITFKDFLLWTRVEDYQAFAAQPAAELYRQHF